MRKEALWELLFAAGLSDKPERRTTWTTPSERGASSSPCPESNINSNVVNRSCPEQSPSTARLNLHISAVTVAVFPTLYIVRTFQVAMFKVLLVERKVIGIVASFRLSPQHVIRLGKPGPASSRTEVLFSFVVHVSVA